MVLCLLTFNSRPTVGAGLPHSYGAAAAACPPACRLILVLPAVSAHRDFTDASVPWGEVDWPAVQSLLPVKSDSSGHSNVLSVEFDNMTYPVTLDGIHTVSVASRQLWGGFWLAVGCGVHTVWRSLRGGSQRAGERS